MPDAEPAVAISQIYPLRNHDKQGALGALPLYGTHLLSGHADLSHHQPCYTPLAVTMYNQNQSKVVFNNN